VVLGGSLSLLNLEVLARIIENIFQKEISSKSAIAIQYVVKVILLLAILYAVIRYNLVDIIAFVVGFSAFLVALLLEYIFPSRRSAQN
jgi:hypothetical protein